MNFEVLVHGVPYGQDYWGPDFDRSYAAQFYNSSEDGLQYVIETRKADGKNYCYYTYARYGNVLDCKGRRGSYVAVTYRFDMLYTDAKRVFQILETVFEKSVVGSIVDYAGTNYKFLCQSLKEKEDVLKMIEDDTLMLLQRSVIISKLLPIDDIFVHQNSPRATCNIVDCTESNVLATLRQVSKLVATHNAPDARDMKIAQLETEKQKQQDEIRKLEDKIASVRTNSDLEAKINQLENNWHESQHELEATSHTFEKKLGRLRAALGVVVALLVLSLGWLAYLKFTFSPQPNGPVGCQIQNDSLVKDTVVIQPKQESYGTDYLQKIAELEEENDKLKRTIVYPNDSDLNIDIKGFSPPLNIGVEYEIRVKCSKEMFSKTVNNDKLYNGYGTWTVTGFNMQETDDPVVVKLTPVQSNSHSVTFTLLNNQKKERQIDVK